MLLPDRKNAAAIKEPPDTVLSSSNILRNFAELVMGFVGCFDRLSAEHRTGRMSRNRQEQPSAL